MQATLEDVQAFVDRCQVIVDRNNEQYPHSTPRKLKVQVGRRYFKIVTTENDRVCSVWAFVDQNGDVLMAASFKAPAKHARGNIFDENGGTKYVGPYGPNYLR